MPPAATHSLHTLFDQHEQELLTLWIDAQLGATTLRSDLLKESELRAQSREFISLLGQALARGDNVDIYSADWEKVRDFLSETSRTRAFQGFTPTETAVFVLSLKEALFNVMQREAGTNAKELLTQVWQATRLLDALSLYTTEMYQKGRNDVIARQQQELLELSTPVVQLWRDILALPLIGTLDSSRTQIVMESLLVKIVETGAAIAIIDITGVPTVDTLVAQHLLKTVAAARLMGADCIISGIRPQIAQTIVHLGVDLSAVTTKSTLADAFLVALKRIGTTVEAEMQKAAR
jgi:rsbT co-antagonist protein RsbR